MRKLFAPIAAVCLLTLAVPASSEVDDQLSAKRRVFPSIGPGFRAIHRGPSGNYYVLASPAVGIAIFDKDGKQLRLIGAPSSEPAASKDSRPAISFGEDFDVDPEGKIFVADRGYNLITVFAADGKQLRSLAVNSPLSVAVLPEGEVAVTTPREPHLVSVYGPNGRIAREFGEPEPLSDRADLNRYLSNGRVVSDPQGRIYYGYTYFPEPLIRQYDRFGYALQDFQFTSLDAYPEAAAARKAIQREEKRSDPISMRPLITAFGVDPVNGDVWMALHNTLLHFDKDGIRRSEYQIYTKEGARLEPVSILVEEDRLLIGSDPLGIYEFARPDRKP